MEMISTDHTAALDRALAQIQLLDSEKATPAGLIKLKGGLNNQVYLFEQLVIKVSGLVDPAILEREAQCLKLLQGKIQVPEIYQTGQLAKSKRPFIIMQQINGALLTESWVTSTPAEQEEAMASIASQLKIVHAQSASLFPRFTSAKITNFLNDCYLRESINQDLQQNLLKYLVPLETSLENHAHHVLTHGDIYFGNIIKQQGTRKLYYIDFDSVAAAPTSRDLVGFIYSAFDPSAVDASYVRKGHMQDLALLKRYAPELFQADRVVDCLRGYFVERVAWFMDKAKETSDRRYQEFGEGLYLHVVQGDFLKRILGM